jgi:aminoglycoside phosphotransferase (APT) family kinase protein
MSTHTLWKIPIAHSAKHGLACCSGVAHNALMSGLPPAEIEIDEALLRGLLAAQHPDLAREPLSFLDSGWDNVMYRLGERLLVRLPRRAIAAPLIENEQAWLPKLAPLLPLPISAPVRTGGPQGRYPWRWSVLPWFDGAAAAEAPVGDDQGAAIGAFLKALHQPAPANAPPNPVRGGPLSERAPFVEERLVRIAAKTDVLMPALRKVWDDALAAPIDVTGVWLHADLHARNVLVRDGAIVAVIDWGDICAGDPATDLSVLWSVLPTRAARRAALEAYGNVSEATLKRAHGWAFMFATTLLDVGLIDDARHAEIGMRALARVSEGL